MRSLNSSHVAATLSLVLGCAGCSSDPSGTSGGGSSTGGNGTGGNGTGGGGGSAGGGNTGGSAGGGTATDSDPVTAPETGSHATYEVGPGKEYEEPDTVPWGALVAGDVVNIYHRDTPYKTKLCLRGQGTAAAPIVVNGVTDGAGHRPVFDFDGSRTATGCNPGGANDIFDTSSQYSLEDYAGILIRPGVDDPYGTKPSHIQIKNLELVGARPGATFKNLLGDTVPFSDSPAGIWMQPSADVLIENDVIHDHGFGVFTMAKDSTLDQACERIVMRSNRVYGNGVVGSYLEHNVYMQSTNPLVEGNYFGVTRSGAEGSTYKSRSSGEIFRYNYVEASARAIDWVHSEDQNPGIATQPDYGVDYAYGNIVVNDCALGNCASNPIHYGGDNLGEQDNTAVEFTPSEAYRAHLFFYNNTVVQRPSLNDSYRTSVFDLSLRSTQVDAWNNVFAFVGTSNYSWVEAAGKLDLRGVNLASGMVVPASDQALAVNYSVQTDGTVLGGGPGFVGANDFHPGPGSPAIDAATGVPAGIMPDPAYAALPVTMQPLLGKNGMAKRTAAGAGLDLGALEGQ